MGFVMLPQGYFEVGNIYRAIAVNEAYYNRDKRWYFKYGLISLSCMAFEVNYLYQYNKHKCIFF